MSLAQLSGVLWRERNLLGIEAVAAGLEPWDVAHAYLAAVPSLAVATSTAGSSR